MTVVFLEDIVCTSTLLPAEHKAATQLLRIVRREDNLSNRNNILEIIRPSLTPSKENLSTLSALEIAEEMTFIDQQILFSISSQSVESSQNLAGLNYY